MQALEQTNRLIQVHPPGDSPVLAFNFSGTETLACTYKFMLDFISTDLTLDGLAWIGKPIGVSLCQSNQEPVCFHGLISQFYAKQISKDNKYRNYQLSFSPWFSALNYSRNYQIFQHCTVPEIVNKLCAQHDSYNMEIKLSKSYPSLRYCTQVDETDQDFIKRILANAGIYYYFMHTASSHKMVLVDDYRALPALSQAIHLTKQSSNETHLNTLSSTQRLTTATFSHKDYDFTKPNNDLRVEVNSDANSESKNDFKAYNYPGYHGNKQEGSEKASQKAEAAMALSALSTASGKVAAVRVAHKIEVNNSSDEVAQGRYWIYSVKHQAFDYSHLPGSIKNLTGNSQQEVSQKNKPEKSRPEKSNPEQSNQEKSTSQYTQLLQIASEQTPYSPSLIAKPPMPGPQTAEVTGEDPETVFTDQYGRIKVHFHWDRFGEKNENSSCWCRAAQTSSGDQTGHQFIPRKGQEVLITYMNGDPDQPYVAGSVFNAKQLPPFSLPENQNKSGFKSRTAGELDVDTANQLAFDDSKGFECYELQAQKDQQIMAKNDTQTTIINGSQLDVNQDQLMASQAAELVIQASNGLYFDAGAGSLHLEPGEIQVKGSTVHVGADPAAEASDS